MKQPGGMIKKFALITTARSGSTWMVDLLHQHPDVKMFGEMFLTRKRRWFAGSGDLPRYVEFPDKWPRLFSVFHYLHHLYTPSAPVRAVGFKLMYSDLRVYPEILWYLARHRIPGVHLVRENLLDVAISFEHMRSTEIAHQPKESGGTMEAESSRGLHLDPAATLVLMRKRERQVALVRKLLALIPAPTMEITYERLRQNPEEFNRVCAFIGVVSPEGQRSNLEKIVTKGQQEVIENYQEIAAALQETPYRRFLDIE